MNAFLVFESQLLSFFLFLENFKHILNANTSGRSRGFDPGTTTTPGKYPGKQFIIIVNYNVYTFVRTIYVTTTKVTLRSPKTLR